MKLAILSITLLLNLNVAFAQEDGSYAKTKELLSKAIALLPQEPERCKADTQGRYCGNSTLNPNSKLSLTFGVDQLTNL